MSVFLSRFIGVFCSFCTFLQGKWLGRFQFKLAGYAVLGFNSAHEKIAPIQTPALPCNVQRTSIMGTTRHTREVLRLLQLHRKMMYFCLYHLQLHAHKLSKCLRFCIETLVFTLQTFELYNKTATFCSDRSVSLH